MLLIFTIGFALGDVFDKKFLLRMEDVNNMNAQLQTQLATAQTQLDNATNANAELQIQLAATTQLNIQLQTDMQV